MKTRSAAWAALAILAFVPSSIAAAEADEAFEPLGRVETITGCAASGAGVTCGRFQGYVVVGPGRIGGAAAESFVAAPRSADGAVAPDSALGHERLYLRTGAGD